MKKTLLILPLIGLLSSCNWFKHSDADTTTPAAQTQEAPLAKIPAFNADSAYAYTKAQVDLGPRTPNSAAHDKCAAWMIQQLRQWADTVYVQSYTTTAYDGKQIKSKNIIASFNPQAASRVFLSSHWDTRPIADEDDHDQTKPIDGANDGASSSAMLLELARSIRTQKPGIGVDLVLFDSEDYGQPNDSKAPRVEDSWCLGSQYWAKTPHLAGYRADFGINLDMVGTADAVFVREGVSVQYADWVSQYVWNIASRMGYSSLFQNRVLGAITDDHYYVNTLLHIPTIDVIHYNETGFGKYHHTHADNMGIINKEMLGTVGKVMLQTIYQYDADKNKKAS
jgi:hypothetical protein